MTAGLSGPLTVEVASFDLDVELRLFRTVGGAELVLLERDRDGGAGSNSRLMVDVVSGEHYVIDIRRAEAVLAGDDGQMPLTHYCPGEIEASVMWGQAPRPPDEARLRADAAYWAEAAARTDAEPAMECRVERLLRRGIMMIASLQAPEPGFSEEEYGRAAEIVQSAQSLAQSVLGREHPLIAASLDMRAWLHVAKGKLAPALSMAERLEYGARAEALFAEALDLRRRQLGLEHLQVARSLIQLAWVRFVLWNARKDPAESALEEVRELAAQALDILDPVAATAPLETVSAYMLLALCTTLLAEDSPKEIEGRALFERGLELSEEHLGPTHTSTLGLLSQLGTLLTDQGYFAEARVVLERGLERRIMRFGDAGAWAGAGHGRLMELGWVSGHYDEALRHFEAMQAIMQRMVEDGTIDPGSPEGASRQATNDWIQGAFLAKMGSYEEAEALVGKAVEIHKQRNPGSEYHWDGLRLLAEIMRETGRYQEARERLEEALVVVNERWGSISILEDLARLYYEMGAYDEAEGYMQRLRELYRQQGEAEPQESGDMLYLGALIDHARGRLERSRGKFEQVLKARSDDLGDGHPAVAAIERDTAMLYADMGDQAAALSHALKAEAIGRDHFILTSRALAERRALSYAAVRASGIDLALSLADERMLQDDLARVWDAVIQSRGLVFDHIASRNRLIWTVSPLARAYSAATDRLAGLLVRGPADQPPDRYQANLASARQEIERLEKQIAGNDTLSVDLMLEDPGLDDVARALQPRDMLLAYVRYDDLRLQSGSAAPRFSAHGVASYLAFVLSGDDPKPQVFHLGEAGEIDSLVDRWRSSVEAGAMLEGLGRLQAEADYRSAAERLRMRIWDPMAATLVNSERLFVVPDGSLNLVSFSALPIGRREYLAERKPLIHYLSTERDLASRKGGSATTDGGLLALGAPAFDEPALFASMGSENVEAAHAARTAAYTPVHYSGGTDERPGEVQKTYRGSLSTCQTFQEVAFEPLPGAAKEVEAIRSLWDRRFRNEVTGSPAGVAGKHPSEGKSMALTGSLASEAIFKREAPGHRLLHLATHGFFMDGRCPSALDGRRGVGGLAAADSGGPEPSPFKVVQGENPMILTGFALAGANHRGAVGRDEEDGILTAEEIAAMNLSGVEWAVLSACDTGVGQVQAREGVFGLRRAFKVAGARTLIMSLWSVDDEATREWMTALYKGRLEQGMTTLEAVNHASLNTLSARRRRGESAHPFYWAGFVAAGDWR